jgi:arabinogalactan oligomer/maltooligosaccharide transport system permease protein
MTERQRSVANPEHTRDRDDDATLRRDGEARRELRENSPTEREFDATLPYQAPGYEPEGHPAPGKAALYDDNTAPGQPQPAKATLMTQGTQPAMVPLQATGAQAELERSGAARPAQANYRIRGGSVIRPSETNLLLTNLLLVAVSILFAFPVYWVIKTSLQGSGGLLSTEFSLLPQDFTLSNYSRVFGDRGFWRSLLNSFIFAGGTTLLSLVLAISAAYAYSRMRFRGRTPTLWAMVLLQGVPATATIIPLYILFVNLGLIDTYWGLIIAYTASTLPFSIWMMKSFFDTIPKDIEEAAQVDGASLNEAFLRVVLPLSLPALAITALFAFFTGWTEFLLAVTFINSEQLLPLGVRLYSVVGENTTEWGFFAAMAVVFALPVMIIFIAFQRYLVGGLTVGGVKG